MTEGFPRIPPPAICWGRSGAEQAGGDRAIRPRAEGRPLPVRMRGKPCARTVGGGRNLRRRDGFSAERVPGGEAGVRTTATKQG